MIRNCLLFYLTAVIPKMASSCLRDYGYDFNEAGKLVKIDKTTQQLTSDPFEFNISSDHSTNQKHYEAIGETITDHVYHLLEEKAKLKRLNVPKDSDSGTFIFVSPDVFENEEKLMILVHGSGVVRAGQWARSLIINDNLNTGTQLPFIEKAKADGYAVMVLNTNDNQRSVAPIPGSETPEKHFRYVWNNYVVPAVKAKKIAIVAHSYGGVVIAREAEKNFKTFQERVFAVAFTDSVHNFKMLNTPKRTVELLREIGCNWTASDKPLDTPLEDVKDDVRRVSAGHPKHEMTSSSSMGSIFKFFQSKL